MFPECCIKDCTYEYGHVRICMYEGFNHLANVEWTLSHTHTLSLSLSLLVSLSLEVIIFGILIELALDFML